MDEKKFLQDVKLVPDRSVLVIIDMENEFCKPGGKHYLGSSVAEVIRNIATLRDRCRIASLPTIYVRSVRYPDNPVFTRFGRNPYLMEGTKGPVIVDELKPYPGEPVVEKHTHDCFHDTEMDRVLQNMGIRCETHRVIVVGVMSNVCVYHAVLGFHIRHYETVLPIDCTTGSNGAEDLVVSQLTLPAYAYNMTLTESDRILMVPN